MAAHAQDEEIVNEIRARLERETGINPRENQIAIRFENDRLIVEGEVTEIAVKRRATRLAGDLVGMERVEDRLTLRGAQAFEDGALRVALAGAFVGEPVFRRCRIGVWNKGALELLQLPPDERRADWVWPVGELEIAVDKGLVTLKGKVISLSHRRMAELLAWWTPGVRGVDNRVEVNPAEQDNDDEISDAVRLALDKDPLIHSAQIRVTTRHAVVTLDGLVAEPLERQMAELDVWYLGADVAGVENRIEVVRPQNGFERH